MTRDRRRLGPSGTEQVPLRDAAAGAPEAQRRGQRVVEPSDPIPARAWIQARESGEVQVDAFVIGWTERQIHVRYLDPHGREGFVWLWATAVTRA